MDDDRDDNWENLRNRGTGGSSDGDRNTRNFRGNQQTSGGDYNPRDRNAAGHESRRDFGNRDFYGSSRDDSGSRGDSSFNSDRGYNVGQSGGGDDEWSRLSTRASGDQYRGGEGPRHFGNADRSHSNAADRHSRDGDRFYGGQAGPNSWSSGRSYGGSERGSAEGGRGFWDKAGDEVSSWFGDRDAERRRDQDQHRGRGPKGYTRSDDRIKDDVNDRLTEDGWLDATDVEVSVSNREVTLSGTVSDRNAKRRAEDIAEGVSGVGHVQNNIRVKTNEATRSGDATSTAVDVDRAATPGVVAKSAAGGQR